MSCWVPLVVLRPGSSRHFPDSRRPLLAGWRGGPDSPRLASPSSRGGNGDSNDNGNRGCGLGCGIIGIGAILIGTVALICYLVPEACTSLVAGPVGRWGFGPPPPPDCYAGPYPTCTPGPAPKSLRDQEFETTIPKDVTNPRDVPKDRFIIEKARPQTNPVNGTSPSAGDSAGRAAESRDSSAGSNPASAPIDQAGTSATPSLPARPPGRASRPRRRHRHRNRLRRRRSRCRTALLLSVLIASCYAERTDPGRARG